MKKSFSLMICILLISTHPIHATIFKCVGDDGVVTFSDQPCSQDAEIAFIGDDPSSNIDRLISKVPTTLLENSDQSEKYQFREKLETHTKAIGNYIFPTEKCWLTVERATGVIHAFFGNKNANYASTVIVRYEFSLNESKNKVAKIVAIETLRYKEHIDTSSMKGVQTLKRVQVGKWKL